MEATTASFNMVPPFHEGVRVPVRLAEGALLKSLHITAMSGTPAFSGRLLSFGGPTLLEFAFTAPLEQASAQFDPAVAGVRDIRITIDEPVTCALRVTAVTLPSV